MSERLRRAAAATFALALTGCSVPRDAGFPDVAAAVEQRVGQRIHWNQGGPEDADVAKAVTTLVTHELGPDDAVQVALLENQNLQAMYEDLMIAQADLVQAGLLQNPRLSGAALIPTSGAWPTNLSLGVEQDFLSVFLVPAKRKLAKAAFEAAKLRVGSEVVRVAYDVRAAYYVLQAAQQVAAMRRTIADAAEASAELARRQHDAGNISELDAASEDALAEQAALDVARADTDVIGARERMNRLMGLWGPATAWRIRAMLDEIPQEDPPLEQLESLAIGRRLDIAAVRQRMQAQSYALATATNTRWIGGVSAGATVERTLEGPTVVGPTASVELPLFDQGQATVARLGAELRETHRRLMALAVEARSEVREARGRLLGARVVVERYRRRILPLRERIVALSQQHYNAMLLGVYPLLQAKQSEVNAYREYIEAVRDYWIARAELERATGGRLAPPAPANPEPPPAHDVAVPSATPSPSAAPPRSAPAPHAHPHQP